jgi:hypothetical protein
VALDHLAHSPRDLLIAAGASNSTAGTIRLMTDFGFRPGILDYWMLLSDWRNGSFAILLAFSVLFLVYALVSSNKNPGGEGPKRD